MMATLRRSVRFAFMPSFTLAYGVGRGETFYSTGQGIFVPLFDARRADPVRRPARPPASKTRPGLYLSALRAKAVQPAGRSSKAPVESSRPGGRGAYNP